jgi:hypothetical protein
VGKHRPPAADTRTLTGVVRQHNFSPKGAVEGLVLDTGTGPVQVNLPHGPDATGFAPPVGTALRLRVATDHHAAERDPGDHPVCEFVADLDATSEPAGAPTAEGVVVRLNYARHGEPNGVVLHTGDFVHLKPHGMRLVPLAVGDRVAAEGPSGPTVTGRRVVEAAVVNGVTIAHKKPHRAEGRP